eukprot:1517082-Lingulodinium_polyedra.AAC.1
MVSWPVSWACCFKQAQTCEYNAVLACPGVCFPRVFTNVCLKASPRSLRARPSPRGPLLLRRQLENAPVVVE